MVNMVQGMGILCFFILLNLGSSSCGTDGNATSADGKKIVVEGCKGKIKARVGTVIELRLQAVRGTGFQWLAKELPGFLMQLDADELKYVPDENRDEVVAGRAGAQVLQFKVLEKGKAEIRLEYKRTFEAGVEDSCVMKVIVK